jgi:hypothetical protein
MQAQHKIIFQGTSMMVALALKVSFSWNCKGFFSLTDYPIEGFESPFKDSQTPTLVL